MAGRLRPRNPLAAVERAIQKVGPDIVVPTDDQSVLVLHALHRRRPELRALIERSLGDAASFDIVACRSRLLGLAAELGIRVADGCEVTSAEQALEAFEKYKPVAVMKADGTNNGAGVRLVRSGSEASAVVHGNTSMRSLAVAMKQRVIDRNPLAMWAWRQQPTAALSAQRLIPGRPANILVACLRGKVLAEVSVEALATEGETGAALAVRRIEDEEMSRAARVLAARLGMSGFFGLDFIREEATNSPYLLEMNPRATQLSYLPLADGSLADVLVAGLTASGEQSKPRNPLGQDAIVIYPRAIELGLDYGALPDAYIDTASDRPALQRALLGRRWPDRQWTSRLYQVIRPPKPTEPVSWSVIGS